MSSPPSSGPESEPTSGPYRDVDFVIVWELPDFPAQLEWALLQGNDLHIPTGIQEATRELAPWDAIERIPVLSVNWAFRALFQFNDFCRLICSLCRFEPLFTTGLPHLSKFMGVAKVGLVVLSVMASTTSPVPETLLTVSPCLSPQRRSNSFPVQSVLACCCFHE